MKEEKSFSALDRQKDIYVSGVSGQKPAIPIDLTQLEERAKEKMSQKAFSYIAGGAGLGKTMVNNRNDFAKWRIRPRMMRDVSVRDISIDLFGKKLPGPFLLSPIGVLDMAHPQADLAVAKAASKYHVPYIYSNQASVAMESCSAVMGDAPRWFQLYWSKSNELVASLVSRAEKCGCSAIVVTLDTTMLGWRIQDLDLAFLPFLRGMGIAQYITDPVFQRLLDEDEPGEEDPPKRRLTLQTLQSVYQMMSNYPDSFLKNLQTQRPLKAVRKFINIYSRPSLTWSDLPFLRQHTKLPILLKGILHPDDAKLAIDHGVDGIIVSNHGGRQVDGSISSIQALPEIAEAVKEQIPILLDSGVRGGADCFKALALGASAVCIGRPYVYGLALAGEQGVGEVIENFLADFELTMGLAGCKNIAEITTGTISRA